MFYPPNTNAIEVARHQERIIARDNRVECMIQRQTQDLNDISEVILAIGQLMLAREKRERDA